MRQILWLCLLGTLARAADDLPIYVYPAPQTAAPPLIDGRLDDAAWADAPVVSGFVHYDKPEAIDVQTSFRVVWDATAIYFGVRCDEPQIDKLVPLPSPPDAKQIFATEAVEVFIDPQHSHADYFQWAVNAAGSLYDSHLTDPAFQSEATSAAQLGDGGWSMELRIPWQPIGARPEPGAVLGFNVCRDRTLLGAREWSCWAPVEANFHDVVRFGHLVLSPTPAQIAGLGSEFRKGNRTGPLRIFGKDGIGEASYLGLAEAAIQRVELAIAALQQEAGEDTAVGTELDHELTAAIARLTTLRRALRPDLDGAAFTTLELGLAALERDLSTLLWDARLNALLKSL